MEDLRILERMVDVYQRSINYPANPANAEFTETKMTISNNRQLLSGDMSEIDGNYLLYFNEIYKNNFLRKWLKKILKKLTWEVLKRQVYFNSAVKDVLHNILHKLIQLDYETSVRHSEVNSKIYQVEQIIQNLQQISEQRFSHLEKNAVQSSEQINSLTIANHQILELDQAIHGLEEKIRNISEELAARDHSIHNTVEAKIRSGLWFNEPIIVGYRDTGEAYWDGTNERILEKSFVIQAITRLSESNRLKILDVGTAESLLSYELASLNYSVTAIDIRPITLSHPNLKFVKSDICKPVFPPASFDCVIALSTLEHIGLGWYGDETGENLDCEAVKQIHLLLKSGGSFILTVPYGKKALTPLHRIYDQESLQRLVQDFHIAQVVYGVRRDKFTWTLTDNQIEASLQEHNSDNYLPGAVAMLVCQKNI